MSTHDIKLTLKAIYNYQGKKRDRDDEDTNYVRIIGLYLLQVTPFTESLNDKQIACLIQANFSFLHKLPSFHDKLHEK